VTQEADTTHNASDIPIETVRVGICIQEEHYSSRL